MNLFDITYAEYNNYVFFPLLFFIAVLTGCQLYKKMRIRQALSAPSQYKKLFIGYVAWRTIARPILLLLGLICLGFVLVRPQWGQEEQKIEHRGRHLFIALDVSKSMLAADLRPSRLEAAKNKIRELVKLLRSDMIGLILFSGEAFVHCPLTTDERAFSMFLDHVDAQIISSGTTALDAAIKKAITSFNASGAPTKLLIVFTDGEDFSSNLLSIKEQAQQEKLTIFTTGIGTPQGAPIPLFDQQGIIVDHQKDEDGSVVISRLNEGMLRALAVDCGGIYVASTPDNQDMKTIAYQVESFEKEALGSQVASHQKDRYHYWAFGAFICFLLEWIL